MLIEQHDTIPNDEGLFHRIRIVETDFKNPFIRIEETIARNPHDGSETVIEHTAMVADHLIVKVPDPTAQESLEPYFVSIGFALERPIPNQPIYVVKLPDPSIAIYDKARSLLNSESEAIAYVEPDFMLHAQEIPNDPRFPQLWGLNNTGQTGGLADADIDVPEAWDITQGNHDVLVGIIDSGIDYFHEDLAANMWINPNEIPGNGIDDDANGYIDDIRGWDFVNNDNSPVDDQNHGSHCAGTIGAVGNNGLGVVGVSQNVSLVALKFLASSGGGTTLDAVAAVYYATSIGVDITSNSWGGRGYSNALKEAIDDAGNHGILFVTSAGNDGLDTDLWQVYPSGYDSENIISVAALDHNDNLASVSNYGQVTVDLGAPGVAILSTIPGDRYDFLSGTSMACPHVAGACALIKSINPGASWSFIKDTILNSTDPVPSLNGKTQTGGRLNIANAIIGVSGPNLSLSGFAFSEDSGNGDTIINPGESISLVASIKNSGSEVATAVQAVLSLTNPDPEVTITDGISTFGNIESGSTVSNADEPFLLEFASTITTPHPVLCTLSITDADLNTWTTALQLTVYKSSVISGTVTDALNDSPIDQSVVHFSGESSGSVMVNPDGTYSISVVDGNYTLQATAPNFLDSSPVAVTTPPSHTDVDFSLGRSKLNVNPFSLTSDQPKDTVRTKKVRLSNTGSLPLDYSINAQSTLGLTVVDGEWRTYSTSSNASANGIQIPFEDSFEGGSLSGWEVSGNYGRRLITGTTAAHGDYSFHFTSGHLDGHRLGIHRVFSESSRPRYISFFVRSGSTLTSDGYFSAGDMSGLYKEGILFYAANDGTFKLNPGTGGDASFPYLAKRWYRIEFRDINWVTKSFDYYVDGVLIKGNVGFLNSTSVDAFSRVYLYNLSQWSEAWWDRISLYDSGAFWVHTSPTQGSIAPGGSQLIDVIINSADLSGGTYLTNLDILSNDLASPKVPVRVTLNVIESPNSVPTAFAQTVYMNEDTWKTVTLMGSDSDGDDLTALIMDLPDKGKLYQTVNGIDLGILIDGPTVVSNPDRKVIFVPDPNEHSSPYATFDFALYDGQATSPTQSITVNVTSVNDAPTARNDFAAASPGEEISTIPVLLNDSDLEGGQLSIVSFTHGSRGTVRNNGDGTLGYNPYPSFSDGSDTFSYTISDGSGASATAIVTVRYSNHTGGDWGMYRNDAAHTGYYPSSLDGKQFSFSWAAEFTYSGLLHYPVVTRNTVILTSDSSNNDSPIRALDVATGTLQWETYLGTFTKNSPPSVSNGKVFWNTIQSNGNSLYSIDIRSGLVEWEQNYEDSYYSSPYGPTIDSNAIYSSHGYRLRVHDAESSSQLFFSTVPGGEKGWSPTVGDGQIFTFTDGVLRNWNPATGWEDWSLTINSSMNGSWVVAYGSNRAYIASTFGLYAINTVSQTVEWSVTDEEFIGTPVVANGVIYAKSNDGAYIQAFDASDGTRLLQYALDPIYVLDLAANQDTLFVSGYQETYIFDLQTGVELQRLGVGGKIALYEGMLLISDRHTSRLSCYVAASDSNASPTAISADQTVTEDTLSPIQLSGTDPDGDGLLAVLTALPHKGKLYQTADGTSAGAQIESVPTIVQNLDFHLMYLPDPDGYGNAYDSLSFKVNDGEFYSGEATVSINVAQVNDPPTAIDDIYFTGPGQTISGVFPQGNDLDPDFEPLSVTGFTQPVLGAVTQEPDGSLTYTPDPSFVAGSDYFSYTVADANGSTSMATVTITIDDSIGSDWTTFGNGPDHTGASRIWFGDGLLGLKWETDLKVKLNQVAVAEDRLYVTPDIPYPDDNWLVALDEMTGSRIWNKDLAFSYPTSSINPPTYHNGRVYIQRGHGYSSEEGTPAESRLWCFDARTGADVWSSPVSAQWQTYMAPCAAGNSVWINGGRHGGIYGFNASDGTDLFFQNLISSDGWTPTYRDGKLYSFVRGSFNNHDPLTGELLWSLGLPWQNSGYRSMNRTVAIDGTRAFLINGLGIPADLMAIDLNLQTVAWQRPASANRYSTPAVSNGIVYVLMSDTIDAYSAVNGQYLRSYTTNDSDLEYQPIASANRLFAASGSATYIFDLSSTNLLQTIPHGGKLSVANETLYIAGSHGQLRSYAIPDTSNHAPVAEPVSATILEESQILIPLTGTDADNDPLHFVIHELPADGKLFQTEDGFTPTNEITSVPAYVSNSLHQVIYQAPLDKFGNGIGNFTFSVADSQTNSNEVTVTIDILNIEDPPIAVKDIVSGRANKTIENFDPTRNDIDVDGNLLSVTSFTQGSYGTVTQNPDGTLNYEPDPDLDEFIDTIAYTITDTTGLTDAGTITVQVSSTLGSEWPTFGNGPGHSGYYPRTLGMQPLLLKWEYSTGSDLNSVAVSSGNVYFTSLEDSHPRISALERHSGAEVWRVNLPTGQIYPPSYDNGSLFVHRNAYSSDSQLWSINTGDGSIRWSSPANATPGEYYAPCVFEDGVWLTFGSLHGFNTADGIKRFSKGMRHANMWTPSYHNGKLYTFTYGEFTQHNDQTGEVIWTLDLGWDSGSLYRTVAFEDNFAYLINNSPGFGDWKDLVCIDLISKSVVWESTGSFYGTPAVAQGEVFAIEGSTIKAFDGSGTLMRTYRTEDDDIFNQPIVGNDFVCISSSNTTYLFDRHSTELKQTIPAGGPLSMASDVLYIASGGGFIQAWASPVSGSDPSVANSQDLTVDEDTPLTVTLSGSDPDAETLHFAIQTLPESGSLYQTSDGSTLGEEIKSVPAYVTDTMRKVIYVPGLNDSGTDIGSFSFYVTDGKGDPGTATISIDVSPVNDAPVARPDKRLASPGQILSPLRVSNNDIDADGDRLTIVDFTAPSSGRVNMNADGTLQYVPDPEVTEGEVVFNYTVEDPHGLASSATVTIFISITSEQYWPTFGNGPGHAGFSALDLESGSWSLDWSFGIQSDNHLNQIAVAGGLAFVTPRYFTEATYLTALNVETGSVVWQNDLGDASSINPPTIWEGSVYVQRVISSGNAQLWSFDAPTGAINWQAPHGAQWDRYFAPCVHDGGVWINGGTNGGMYGFDSVTGQEWFFHSLSQSDQWTPSYHEGKLYSYVAGSFTNHDPVSGSVLWSLDLGWNGHSHEMDRTVAFEDKFAYLINNTNGEAYDRELVCIDLQTQSVRWRLEGNFHGTPAIAQGIVYVVQGEGVSAVDSSDGSELGLYDLESPLELAQLQPLVTRRHLFASSMSNVYIFDRWTFSLVQAIPHGGYLSVAGNQLFIAGFDGTVYAYSSPDHISFSPGSGALHSEAFAVTIAAMNPLASIYYTLDGSAPGLDSPWIASGESVTIYRDTTVRAIAVDGSAFSSIYSANYYVTDTDNDGIPDFWEQLHFKNLTICDGSRDSDGDGLTDRDELIVGSSPVKASEHFQFNYSKEGESGPLSISWESKAGRIYCIEASDDLQKWVRTSGWATGDGNTMVSEVEPTQSTPGKRFYRIRAE